MIIFEKMASNRAFSLIELIIVVVILGLVAAIAVPRISRAAEATAEAKIKADLGVLRKAIELYAAEHNGIFPGANGDGANGAGTDGAFERQLLYYSDEDGLVSQTPDPAYPFGPYLKSMPRAVLGPANGDNRVNVKTNGTPISGVVSPNRAWKYDAITGQIIFNYKADSSDGVTRYDQF